MTRIEVTNKLNFSINQLVDTLQLFSSDVFFTRKDDKWSPAEQAQHLVLSVKPLQLAFRLPGFALGIMFGKMNRAQKSYEELLSKYHRKLNEGGKASSPYIPKQLKTGTTPQQVIESLQVAHQHLIKKVNGWKESDLDKYVLPHPLLGKISLREMLYFTDLHILHHQNLIKSIYLHE